METNGSKYLNMIHHFEDELFSVVFYLDKVLGQRQVVNILVLLNKFYPSYTCLMNSPECEGESEEDVKWEDVVTGGNSFTVESYLDFQFNIPVFVQKGTEVEFVYTTEGGMKLTLEKDERFTFVLILDINSNTFVDKNFFSSLNEDQTRWKRIETEQSLAASKNRRTLASFLKELENLLGSEISSFDSSKFIAEHIYKYGFKDDACFFDRE